MLQGIIEDAKSAAGSVVAKYAVRASVAIPFLIALAAATLAVTFMLSERFGAIAALWSVAGGFTLVGGIAALIVATTENMQDKIAVQVAETPAVANPVSEAGDPALGQVPLALFAEALVAIGGPTTVLSVGRLAGRNLPLVLMAGAIGLLLFPTGASAERQRRTTAGIPIVPPRASRRPDLNGEREGAPMR